MANYSRIFACSTLVFILSSLFLKAVNPCSPNPYKPDRDITELAILAPVVIVARVVNISVDSSIQLFTQYSACVNVTEVIKRDDSTFIPQTFCTKHFGTEAMCLSHVFPNLRYVFYLNTDLQARYDAHFSAASPATDVVIALARRGYCDVKNSTNCVLPNMTDVPKKLITVDEGGSIVLTCRASGTKPYVVTWFYEGDSTGMPLYSTIGYDGSFILRKMSTTSQGKYTCIVKNAAGSVSHETKIVVRLKHCGGVFMVNKRMDITSPNFPYEYAPDKTCVWRLCPPRSYRIKFHFNTFDLHASDSLSIDNECDKSQDFWRVYCGHVSPGEFVSRCKSNCVQLRLRSKFPFENGPRVSGMNVTVEPTRKKRTKKFDVLKYYCDSDLVIKGRFIRRNPWPFNHIKVFAFDSFKEPFAQNRSYDVVYKNEDRHGCYYNYHFVKDYFYFATNSTTNKGVFTVTTAIADDGSRDVAYLKKMLPKYKKSLCQPPLPE